MHKQIVINSTANEVRVALMEDHQLVEVSMERADARRVVGNVYKGIVTAVRPGLQAAFVDIGMDKAGFLHVSDLAPEPQNQMRGGREDRGRGRGRPVRGRGRREGMRPIEHLLKEGQEIIVQVTKEIIGTKGPRLTADVSLPGRFLVMMPYGEHVGVSRKIDDRRERSRLRDMLDKVKPSGRGAYIIRTAGDGMTEELLRQDTEYLRGLWDQIEANARTKPAPSLLHEDVGMIVALVRDIFKDDIAALHIDNERDFEQLHKYVDTFAPNLRSRLQLYEGTVSIFDKFGIEAEIKKSLDRKVWLNRGGFLVIEQTEALVAIDVNTGRYTGKRNQEETILRTNMMAAREIPRQLRLRDIGGIIVTDFIDMENEADKRRVLNELRTQLKHDRARTKTFAVSDLGLIEMSRQRVRQSVKDQLSDECPFCRGTGQVLSIDTLLNKVERLVEKVPLVSRDRKIQIQAAPSLAVALQVERGETLRKLARSHGMKIDIVDDGRLHREDFKIIALGARKDLVPELEDGRKALSEGARQRSRSESSRDERRSSGSRRSERADRGGEGRRERRPDPRRRDDSREEVASRSRSEERGRGRRRRRGASEDGARDERPAARTESRTESRTDTRADARRDSRPEVGSRDQRGDNARDGQDGRRRRRRRRGSRRGGSEDAPRTEEVARLETPAQESTPPQPVEVRSDRSRRRDEGTAASALEEATRRPRRRRRRRGRGGEEGEGTDAREAARREAPLREETVNPPDSRRSAEPPREEVRREEPRREAAESQEAAGAGRAPRRHRRVRRSGAAEPRQEKAQSRQEKVEPRQENAQSRSEERASAPQEARADSTHTTDWDPSPSPPRRDPSGGADVSSAQTSGESSETSPSDSEQRPRRRRRRRRTRGGSASSGGETSSTPKNEDAGVRAESASE